MDKYKTTFSTWNKIARLYEEVFMDLDIYNATYDMFCDLIPNKQADILEIGCGPGNITRYLLAKRNDFKMLCTDVAPNMINLAEKNNPQAQFRIMDCRDIDKLSQQFQAIICGFCMPYLSKSDISKLIKDSYQLLLENGIFYGSLIEGNYNKSGYETGSTGDKTFVYYYHRNEIKTILEQHNFKDVNIITIPYKKRDNVLENHLIFIAKKSPITRLLFPN